MEVIEKLSQLQSSRHAASLVLDKLFPDSLCGHFYMRGGRVGLPNQLPLLIHGVPLTSFVTLHLILNQACHSGIAFARLW